MADFTNNMGQMKNPREKKKKKKRKGKGKGKEIALESITFSFNVL